MSSATSTETGRLKPDATRAARTEGSGARSAGPGSAGSADHDQDADAGLQPWQFFVLAALGCATAVTFVARGQGPTAIILLSLLMGTAGLVGYATLRMVRPLVAPEEDRTVMIGERTRVALEREKLLTLRSIKELEFDRAMGRLSEADYHEMASRLRARAATLIRQLDAGAGYRDQIERDLAKRLGPDPDARLKPSRDEEERGAMSSAEERGAKASAERLCASCQTANDNDARFCKGCGQPFSGR
ncbi:MAG TPA: zinc ribbon domain-containing protein [Vicinamibacterales bacterium]|nr:zinc ribbon domain-containing protein [Vicinamibacterales bacterium]